MAPPKSVRRSSTWSLRRMVMVASALAVTRAAKVASPGERAGWVESAGEGAWLGAVGRGAGEPISGAGVGGGLRRELRMRLVKAATRRRMPMVRFFLSIEKRVAGDDGAADGRATGGGGRHGVVAAGVEGVALAETAGGEPDAAQGSVGAEGVGRVVRAGGGEAAAAGGAAGRVERGGDQHLIQPDAGEQHS